MPGLDIVELLCVENVLPVMRKKGRHCRHNARAVRAGQSHDELAVGHGEGLDGNLGMEVAPCSIS
jgi:hypothetical protein